MSALLTSTLATVNVTAVLLRSQALTAAFGERLREIRKNDGMSQDALGRRAGLSRTSITNIEQGRQHVSLDVLYRLADALGLEPSQLLPAKETLGDYEAGDLVELEGLPRWDQQFVRAAVKKVGIARGGKRE